MKRLAVLAFLAFTLSAFAGCSVETSPAPSSSEAAPGVERKAETEVICRANFVNETPAGSFPCTSGQTWGGVEAFTSPGYTAAGICPRRASMETPLPVCSLLTSYTYAWMVQALANETLSLSPAACEASYVDYNAFVQSRSTQQWSSLEGGRAYGHMTPSGCLVEFSDWYYGEDQGAFEVTADAFTPIYWFGDAILGYSPLDLEMRTDRQ